MELIRDMYLAAYQNSHWPLVFLRDNLMGTVTKQILLYPSNSFYAIEQMYRAIDYVIEQET